VAAGTAAKRRPGRKAAKAAATVAPTAAVTGPAGAAPAPVAVIDIGSNSVRLVIYDDLSRAPFPRFNEKSLCGLGRDLESSDRLPEDAIAATVNAVHRYCAIAQAMQAHRIDILATEAVRRAANGHLLVEAIESRSGHPVRILSGAEEAQFAAQGVIAGFWRPAGIVGDLGGGSLELSCLSTDGSGQPRVSEDFASLPLGALRLQPLMARDPRAVRDRLDATFAERPWPRGRNGGDRPERLYVVGGGWRALARVHLAMSKAPLKIVHGLDLDLETARGLTKAILKSTPDGIRQLPGVPSRRADTLQTAALVLDRLLKAMTPDRVVFSALGLREGWLYACLPPAEQALDPLMIGAAAFGRPRARVPHIGEAMQAWTAPLFAGETEAEARLRLAACELSDFGWRDHPELRALQSFHRLTQFPFVGLDHAERVFLATAIFSRYGGNDSEPEIQPMLQLLAPAVRQRALVLGRALQLGYRFSGSVPELLAHARLALAGDTLRLVVSTMEDVPDTEPVRTRLKNVAKALGVRRTEIVKP
jgi:exopolyphosphatase / guanosine-5'-triphosphate,3'-diphosphate pyrophosphatase